ncbi:MAG: hypothetical protein ACON5F_02270 [Jejuia sp.]
MNKTILCCYALLILFGCQSKNDNSSNLKSFVSDKTWIEFSNKFQYYYSSKDDGQYLWMTFERREDGTYTPFTPAKGDPYTHHLPNTLTKYREGWSKSSLFKIIGDSLVLQDQDDIKAENLTSYHLEIISDTTIGIIDYYRLKKTNDFGSTIWHSKK